MDLVARSIIENTLKHEGGYQNKANDVGNYCADWGKSIDNAVRAGTNYGITARTLFSKGILNEQTCNPQTMRNMSRNQAIQYAYELFYLPYQVYNVKDLGTAKHYFDLVYMGAGNALEVLTRAFPSLSWAADWEAVTSTLNELVEQYGPKDVNTTIARERAQWFRENPNFGQWPGWEDRALSYDQGGNIITAAAVTGGFGRDRLLRAGLFLGLAYLIYRKLED
jgi:lysozyme family protein